MNDEYNYEPYEYGKTQKSDEPQFEEETEVNVDEEVESNNEPQFEDEVIEPAVEEQPKEEASSMYAYKYTNYYETIGDQPQSEEKKEEKREAKKKKGGVKKVLTTIALGIIFGFVASGVFVASNIVFGNFLGIQLAAENKEVGVTQVATSSGTTTTSDVADVVENVMPSVVAITNMSVQEVQNFFYGTTQYESESRGSGIIIGQNDTELLIVTNYHVVEGSTSLTVTFNDDANVEAQIKGTDSDRDLAIIAVPLSNVESTTIDAIKIATLGDSDALRVGETAIAIGNALGYGQSVTCGIISAVGRTLDDYAGSLIQTDAAINEGNSGGALLNANGEVIGINSAKLYGDTVESMGYAIPISDVVDILNELMSRETRTKVDESKRGVLGIYGATVDATYMQYYNMPAGVYVSQVIEGGGAEAAGLPVNSIITKIDGTSISSMEDLQEQLEYYKAGETVELTIQVPGRGGYAEEKIEVTLTKSE